MFRGHMQVQEDRIVLAELQTSMFDNLSMYIFDSLCAEGKREAAHLLGRLRQYLELL